MIQVFCACLYCYSFSVHVYIVHGYVGVFCFCCVCVCLGGWGGGVFLNRIYISFIGVVPTFSCLLHFVVAFLWKQMGGRLWMHVDMPEGGNLMNSVGLFNVYR